MPPRSRRPARRPPGAHRGAGQALGSRLRVSWSLAHDSKTAEELARGDIDLALIPRITQVTGVQTAILCEDSCVGVARPGHPVLASGLDLDAFRAWRAATCMRWVRGRCRWSCPTTACTPAGTSAARRTRPWSGCAGR